MKITAVRKDKTAAKLEDGNWYNADPKVQQYLEKGKDARIEGDKIVFVSNGQQQTKQEQPQPKPQQPDQTIWEQKDKRITRLATLNTATEIVKLAMQQPTIDEAGNIKKMEADKIADIVITIAEKLEGWVWRE